VIKKRTIILTPYYSKESYGVFMFKEKPGISSLEK
jgi:hypothetical protein